MDKKIDYYKDKLPNILLDNWKIHGFSAFKDGLYWLTDPDEFRDLLDTHLEKTILEGKPRLHVIARSAFGRLFIWEEHVGTTVELDLMLHNLYYDSQKEKLTAEQEEEEMKNLLQEIPRVSDMYDKDGKPLFKEAMQKCGKLAEDEIYAYKHQLYLGGENNMENINKVNLYIHADIQKGFEIPALVRM